MPLIECPDCSNPVSDMAPACLHCGRPIAGTPDVADEVRAASEERAETDSHPARASTNQGPAKWSNATRAFALTVLGLIVVAGVYYFVSYLPLSDAERAWCTGTTVTALSPSAPPDRTPFSIPPPSTYVQRHQDVVTATAARLGLNGPPGSYSSWLDTPESYSSWLETPDGIRACKASYKNR